MSSDPEALLPADQPAAVLDEAGVVRAWNAGAEELLAIPASAACGHDLPDLLFPADVRRAHGGGLAPFTGWAHRRQPPLGRWLIPVVRGDGSFSVIDMTLGSVELDGRPGHVATFRALRTGRAGSLPDRVLLERIFDHAPEAVTVVERDGRQRFVNARGLELLGHGTPDGEPVDGYLLVHPDDLFVLERLRSDATDQYGRPRSHRYRVRAGDGSWRWLESIATDLTGDPEVGATILFSRDVTEDAERAQALRTAQARLEAVVANISAAAMLEDDDRRPVLWNRLFDDLVSSSAGPVQPGFDTTVAVTAVARLAATPTTAGAAVARLGGEDGIEVIELFDGRALEVESVGIRRGDESLGRLWLIRDVTDRFVGRHQHEQLLALEQEARRLAEEQTARLRDFDQLRGDFVASVSHELRTPLTSVISAVDYLITSTPEEQGEDLPRFLDVIQRNAVRLSRLVDDLLVVSRLDAGMLTLDDQLLDPVALVAGLVDDLAPRAADRRVTLRFRSSPGPALRGDRFRLQQVVENLLTNAVKFTEPGTPVDVRCTYADGSWTISIRDRGPGIDPAQRERVFDRFYRSPATIAAGNPGTGLGLTIARGLVELHHGTLTVSSPPGGGAELRCVLPLSRPVT